MKRMMSVGAGVLLALGSLMGCSSERMAGDSNANFPYDFAAPRTRSPAPTTAAAPVRTETRPAATTPTEAPRASVGGSAVCYPMGGQRDHLCIERSYPAEVVAGQNFEYMIKVTNVSGITLDDVVVTESMPTGFTVASTNPQGVPAQGGKAWDFPLGRFNPGESKTIRVAGSAKDVATVNSCATLTYTIPVCMTIPVVKPSLALVKTAPAEVMLCDMIPVRLVVTNNGTGAARNVKVSDALPAGLKTTDGKTTLEFDAGTLAAGQSREFTFNVKADKRGSYQNTGKATADGISVNSGTTTTVVRQPELAIKAECPGEMMIGRTATVKFTVTNKGDGVCNNTTVTSPLPTGATFVSADNGGAVSGSNVSWNLGALAPNASKTVSMTVRTTGSGNVTAAATAVCVCANAVTDQCTFGVKGVPDMATLLTDDDGVVLVGTNHTLRYEVANQGQVDLTNVNVVVTLPEGMEFVSTTATVQPRIEGRKLTFTATNVLKPGERRAYTLTVKTTKPGEFLVESVTTCAELRSPVRDDEVTVFVPQ